MMTNTESAVRYTMGVLRYASDGQEGEWALRNHDRFGPWLLDQTGGDEDAALMKAQRIVSSAEQRLGNDLPY